MEARGDDQGNAHAEAALEALLRRIHLWGWVWGAIWVLATVIVTLWASDRILSGYLDEAAVDARQDARTIAGIVDRTFYELAAIPQVLATSRQLLALVGRYNAEEDRFSSLPQESRRSRLKKDPVVARVGERLSLLRDKLNYDLIYVLDSRGIRIATSDWDRPISLLGERLDDREYFTEAMQGTVGQMFAVGRTTQVPVLFFSAPMEDEGRPVGVVVARQDTEVIGSMLAGTHRVTLIVDAAGMVVAASHPEFALRHVGALADARPDPETLRKIYGQEKLVALAAESPASRYHEAEWLIEKQRYLLTRAGLKNADYSLLFLTPIDWLERERPLHYLIGALAALFGVLVALFRDRQASVRARRRHDAIVTAALNEKLRALNAQKDHFLGIAAHDLRNPLSSMRGLAQLMLEMPLEPPQQREFLETIQRTSNETLGLVNDLLDVSVIESGKLELKRTDHDLVKMVQRRVRQLEPHARSKKIAVSVDAPDGQHASIDGSRFNQVVDNLVSNAIKFSPSGSTVQVALRSRDGSFTLSVQDQGPGISEQDRKLLFRSFQKLSARPTGGEKSTGLGLAIVKKIVDAHGGNITVDDAPGGGTVFTVTAPTGGQG